MTVSLASDRAVKPVRAGVVELRVIAARRISEGFVRVTVGGDRDRLRDALTPIGHDQWARLFFPAAGQRQFELPAAGLEGWYQRLAAIPEAVRPQVRNYTIRETRDAGDELHLDVDFVVHRSAAGLVEGEAASWALRARPGDRVGMLDQGRIFSPPELGRPLLIVTDESGLPGVEGVVRSLEPGVSATVVVEIAHAEDRRPLTSEAALEERWHVRALGAVVGAAALRDLRRVDVSTDVSAYVVGEASFVLEARRMLIAAGLPKAAIDFCSYWRREPAQRHR
ncbi:siderophore-interacting protein [Agrococcus baldri]|uniref:Siderophore-interacting protein n=1 Tax=Agrococcus baldri TaxID=153730 RepID=A0AA87RGQ5_9MICO|nr:siderophore-interacting protein [Agrococcus baldri]GEK79298.1 siderophore-interacting protein [Agrococcus baldri]